MPSPTRTRSRKEKYRTPGPGSYNLEGDRKSLSRYGTPRASSFGSAMCKYDREKTGPLSDTFRARYTPSPDQYGTEAAGQALSVKFRDGNASFSKADRWVR